MKTRVESPCTRVCVMDGDKRYCLGCWRTLQEIVDWGSMRDEEQAAVLAQLERRRADAAETQGR